MIDSSLIGYVRKPNVWNTYDNPIDNLLHAILIQAVADCNGYKDECHKWRSGDEAIEYLESEGKEIFDYLIHIPRADVSKGTNKARKERLRKVQRNDNKR